MDLLPGQVAIHDDGSEHMALILKLEGDECEALFFTSNPHWADVCRKASRDELAMACYVSTKRTYLAYVVRPIWNFSPTEQPLFPAHWVEILHTEFKTQQSRISTVMVNR